jgi:hypothetical protein
MLSVQALPRTPAGVSNQATKAAPAPTPVVGELVRVTPDAMTISVKTANGVEVVFHYTDKTVVSGSDTDVPGLATRNGNQVTITYTAEGSDNIATKIEVREKA